MFTPIGVVKCNISEKIDRNWGKVTSKIIIDEHLMNGLKGLSDFSHIIIVYHLNQAKFIYENHLTRKPQGRDDMPNVGIFSQRAKDRPNPIGVTAVKLISIDKNIVEVQGLDAINDTPVLDIKPYYPVYDLRENATVPEWVNILMKNYF